MCWFFCVPIQKLIFISINCIFLSVKGDWSGVSRWKKSITLLDNLFVWKIVLYCTSQKIGPSSFKNIIYKYVHILSNLSLFYGKQEIRMAQTKSFLPFVVYQFIVDFFSWKYSHLYPWVLFHRFWKVGSTTSQLIGGRTVFCCTRWWLASHLSMEMTKTTYFIPLWMTPLTTLGGFPRRQHQCLVWFVSQETFIL